MSYGTARDRPVEWPSPVRIGALMAAGLVLSSFLTTIYHVVDVVGDPQTLIVLTVISLVAATICARVLSVRRAAVLAAALLGIGITWYLAELPGENTFALVVHVEYLVALLSGHSILVIVNLEDWILAVTPTPVFLTWYLTLKRRYGGAAVVGGSTVGFFVLTGDATVPVVLVGSVGVLALLGLGTLDHADASLAEAEVVSVVLAAVIVVTLSVSVVPQGAAMTYTPDVGFVSSTGQTNDGTIEADLLSAGDRIGIVGSAELSTEVRWTVESDVGRYWRVAAYDLYTGDGWNRRVTTTDDRSALRAPPGPSREVIQRFTAESRIDTLPAAWRPTSVVGVDALVTRFGGLQPSQTVEAGQTYAVESRVPNPTVDELRRAGTDYPDGVSARYLQVPSSTSDRVGEMTAEISRDAETSYGTAKAIEQWLQDNKGYSLSVDLPSGDVAESFLFEMERGYCTYFATTMAVMLRTQGIPARMVVGYTPGQQTEDDTWTVRGYNSHAWVEVYFPEIGWVQFDPTPAAPREQAERATLSDRRVDGNPGPGIGLRPSDPITPGEFNDTSGDVPLQPGTPGGTNGSEQTTTTPENATSLGADSGSDDRFSGLSHEQLLLGTIIGIGMIASIRRSGASERIYRAVRLRWQPRSDPMSDVLGAYQRLEHLLEREHRARHNGETPRQYVDAIGADERAEAVVLLYERARYADEADERAANRAVELVDAMLADR